MNYGIVGLGKQGKQHLSALLSLSKIDTNINVYLCDIDKIYINQLARELNLISYCSCAEMLQNINIDILILALPNDKYKEVLDLPECKNILIIKEKPFAMNLNEANLFLKFAKDKNLSLNISQHRYFTNHYVLAKEWLSQNLIGNILFFEYRYTLNDQKESWYWDLKSGGGCWLNVGWHFAFIIDWFFGAPKSIKINKLQSSKRAWDYGTDDTVFVDCEYNNFHGSGYLSVVDSSSEDVFKIVGGSGTINIYKNHSELIDNNGNILFKEKAENLLGYIYQIKNIPIKEVALKLSLHNFNAMQIINNSL